MVFSASLSQRSQHPFGSSPRGTSGLISAPVAVILALFFTVLGFGCSDELDLGLGDILGNDEAEALSNEAADSVETAVAESALLVVSIDNASADASINELADAAVTNATNLYSPGSCLSTNAIGPQVTLQMENCSGPYGLVGLTGTVLLAFATVSDDIQVTATSTDLSVNGGTVSLNAVALYSLEGTAQELTITTTSVVVGPRGNAMSKTGTYIATWDDSTDCFSLTGTWASVFDSRTFSTSVNNYEVCGRNCPTSGGTVIHVNTDEASSNTVTINYDGGDAPTYIATNGGAGVLSLSCTEN